MKIEPVWFDSLGAKSSCVYVETSELKILIDPGAAVMHPSFPASFAKKLFWYEAAWRRIKSFMRKADVIVISHYHWDHFCRDVKLYEGKLILAKNPNEYINDEQRRRAYDFFTKLWKHAKQRRNWKKGNGEFEDIADKLRSVKLDFGDYQRRRNELLKKGKEWFERRVEKWKKYEKIPNADLGKYRILFPEGMELKFGKTRLKFIGPIFHGIEYSRVGWIFMTYIKEGKESFLHTSDVNGPIIEDYADLIIKLKPTYICLDGPPTYMLGYLLNRINLKRAVRNACRIVKKVKFKWMIYDHHLPREKKFRERTKEVWELARKLKRKVCLAAELMGRRPVLS